MVLEKDVINTIDGNANIFRSALQIIEGTCTDNRHYSITGIQFKTDTRRNEGPARKLTNYEEKGRHERWMDTVYRLTTKGLIEGVISGYNATVFAYGPTGCGKTYTMLGTDREPGIYIRTLNDLFKAIEETSDDMEYEVLMSYLEIYNEMIRDLLNPALGYLDLREDSKGVIQVAGITEVSTINAKEIMQLLMKGNKQRTQEPTAANKTSSRSHAILQVTVRQKSRVKNITQEVRVGRLFMIDLAGSERASQVIHVTQDYGINLKPV
ncbi:unnamed protein product [Ranitomeya imitator]|uniref:Kinesin-like protein n=1 Tax=Ranitomeya imitator TaxID=111125 RepID=A0ABN9KTK3_9NEOB|nr:unnamed protein product [Ranitomeya imitator]